MRTLRARKTPDQWAALIEQQHQSGQTILEFCKINDVGPASFSKWKQKLAKEASPPSDNVPNAPFQSVRIEEPVETERLAVDKTTVTLALGATITLTIQSNEATR